MKASRWRFPDATLADISHEIPAHDLSPAPSKAAAYRYFPVARCSSR
jgi:hypothetical protein